jgi:nitroreductase
MLTNPILETMLNRKSIRHYTHEMPGDDVITAVVRAGQQAPFASQLGSLLLSRDQKNNPFKAPLLFTICVDAHRWELIMKRRNWQMMVNDGKLLLIGMQDAALMAENMVIAAESLGMGSCFLGHAPYRSEQIIAQYNLPKRVFPMIQLAMGYPDENPLPRPRYPLEFTLFEDRYPELSEELINESMGQMDEGYLAQDYYRSNKAKIPLQGDRRETFTFDNYSWTEHICRKWGQINHPDTLLEQLQKCGFDVCMTDLGNETGEIET